MKYIVQIVLLLLFIASCISEKKQDFSLVSGNLNGMSGQWLYFEELEINRIIPIDSVQVDPDDNFEIDLDISEPGFFILKTSDDNYILLLIEPDIPITINTISNVFMDGYEAIGSEDSQLLQDFEQFMINQKQQVDSLAIELNKSKVEENYYTKKMQLDSMYLEIYNLQRDYVINFIESNPASLVSLIVINRRLGNNKILDEEEDFIYFHKLDSALLVSYPNNKHALDHHNRIQQIRGDKFDRFVVWHNHVDTQQVF